MFIPPKHVKKYTSPQKVGGKIRLQGTHLIIDHEIANTIFGKDTVAYVVYYPGKNTLMMAAYSDELFKKLHKTAQQMLKDRNLKGDKSLALGEILIDNQLDESDRDLEYKVEAALGILSVQL